MNVTIGQIRKVLRDEPGLTVSGFKTLDEGYWTPDHGGFLTSDALKTIQVCVDFLSQFHDRPRRTSVSSHVLLNEVSKTMPDVKISHGAVIVAAKLTGLRCRRRPDRADVDITLASKDWRRISSRQAPLLGPLEVSP
ncbi:MAG: hypothetical protein HQK57_10150 [Deltaproteobacteria bacterium]|nr:hypothetical protein [Deltaproteobacteria bacterium]